MNSLMFDEVGVTPGKPYKYGDWKAYAVHDENNIKGFFGEYRWLSNFHEAEVEFEGLTYPSTENAYQAAKIHPTYRGNLVTCKPYESKKIWKKYPLLDENDAVWDGRKLTVMTYITLDKYNRHAGLRNKLLATRDKYLEETNHWGDSWYGVDVRKGGRNELGKLLMNVRTFWKNKSLG